MNLLIRPMSLQDAGVVIGWRYEGEYGIYDIRADDLAEETAYLIDPENHFYGIYHDDELIGHAVFHAEARVRGGDYSRDALDIGAGMRPDWTGRGKGAAVIARIIAFGGERYGASVFRATIAAWNVRAQKAALKNGFAVHDTFTSANGRAFVILLRVTGEIP